MTRKIRLIKGASYTGNGIYATKKKPEIVVEEAIADRAVASGFFKFTDEPAVDVNIPSAEGETPVVPEGEQESEEFILEDMTYTQLKEVAAQMGISTKGLKSKASLVAAINEATEADPVVVSETMLHLQED